MPGHGKVSVKTGVKNKRLEVSSHQQVTKLVC